MPTIILLDNSLAMNKFVKSDDGGGGGGDGKQNDSSKRPTTKREISHLIVKKLIENFSKTHHYEHVALVAFSSTAQVVCESTRDYTKLIELLENLKVGNSCLIDEGLNKASELAVEEWAGFTNVNIILITDDVESSRTNSVRQLCEKLKENKRILKNLYVLNGVDFDEKMNTSSILNDEFVAAYRESGGVLREAYYSCQYPFSFPNRFDVVCLSEQFVPATSNCQTTRVEYEYDDLKQVKVSNLSGSGNSKLNSLTELLELNNSTGRVFSTESLQPDYVQNKFVNSLFEEIYHKVTYDLKCGHLSSTITLIPNPTSYKGYQNYSYVNKKINRNLEICGYINITDLNTPPTISRHLVILDEQGTDNSYENRMDVGDTTDNTMPFYKESFSILLHACLKSENMAAIVCLGEEWYGAVHSWQETKADSTKKKSNLMLSIFVPGNDILQSIISKAAQSARKPGESASNQIARLSTQKSYSKGCIIWYREYNLVSDIQKILRTVKKINEKMAVFYKELNRVRKAALSIGFYSLLHGLKQMLERELVNHGANYTPEATIQITHVINCLNSIEYMDYKKEIQPWIVQAPFVKTTIKK